MSTQDIIAELPKLTRPELEQVDAHLHELLRAGRKSWGEALLEVAGSAQGLPPDLAEQHDYYLHGGPRR
jgi:hypothetical protein